LTISAGIQDQYTIERRFWRGVREREVPEPQIDEAIAHINRHRRSELWNRIKAYPTAILPLFREHLDCHSAVQHVNGAIFNVHGHGGSEFTGSLPLPSEAVTESPLHVIDLHAGLACVEDIGVALRSNFDVDDSSEEF
jgi:hypothetical protein